MFHPVAYRLAQLEQWRPFLPLRASASVSAPITWTWLSYVAPAAPTPSPLGSALAYNVANLMRMLPVPKTAELWFLRAFGEKVIKIAANVVNHGRYVTFQMAEVAVSREMFADPDAHRPAAGPAAFRGPPYPGGKWLPGPIAYPA
jgi:hypothetical protein